MKKIGIPNRNSTPRTPDIFPFGGNNTKLIIPIEQTDSKMGVSSDTTDNAEQFATFFVKTTIAMTNAVSKANQLPNR
ncbi:MAG: hypothetical protein AAGA30_02935 [Planctomycetota bacterium]